MALIYQATSQYHSQGYPGSLSWYVLTRPKWVKSGELRSSWWVKKPPGKTASIMENWQPFKSIFFSNIFQKVICLAGYASSLSVLFCFKHLMHATDIFISPDIWQTTSQNTTSPPLCHFVCHSVASSEFRLELQFGNTQFRFKLVWWFLSSVTLKFDEWLWKIIGHLFYATSPLYVIS